MRIILLAIAVIAIANCCYAKLSKVEEYSRLFNAMAGMIALSDPNDPGRGPMALAHEASYNLAKKLSKENAATQEIVLNQLAQLVLKAASGVKDNFDTQVKEAEFPSVILRESYLMLGAGIAEVKRRDRLSVAKLAALDRLYAAYSKYEKILFERLKVLL